MEGPDRLIGKKILIVDDELDVLETLEELLSVCLIDKAPSFETAVKFLNKNQYDGAIFDIMGVRGYELLRIATGKGVPVLMLTAHALSPDNLIKSIKEGAQSYVPKDNLSQIAIFLGEMIEATRQKVSIAANATLTTLYWQIGRHIRQKYSQANERHADRRRGGVKTGSSLRSRF